MKGTSDNFDYLTFKREESEMRVGSTVKITNPERIAVGMQGKVIAVWTDKDCVLYCVMFFFGHCIARATEFITIKEPEGLK